MSPVQVAVIPVAGVFFDYVRSIERRLRDDLFRVQVDDSDDSFGKKIRNAATHKVPNLWIVGQKELDTESVTWRRRGHENQPSVGLGAAHAALRDLRTRRVMDNFPDVEVPGWA
jgi:threonyl-tRNA synthetase